jgi:nucleotide-binding universal stress UspA family protein
VPFDFSEASRNALEYAVDFVGRESDIKIVLSYFSGHCNFKLYPENFKKIEKKYSSLLKTPLEWTIKDNGSLTKVLLEIQKTKDIDLIVMGTEGAKKEGNAQPTNTSQLVLAADSSVLVVPNGYREFRLKRIALVLGQHEIDDRQSLATLLEVARKSDAKVYVVTIANQTDTFGYSEEEEKNEKTVEHYLENFYEEHVFIKNKDVVEGILTYTTKNDLDLIAILPGNHNKRKEPTEGKLTHMLTLYSKVPVLAID